MRALRPRGLGAPWSGEMMACCLIPPPGIATLQSWKEEVAHGC